MEWLDPKTNPIPTLISDFIAIIDDFSDESCGYRLVAYVHQCTYYNTNDNFQRKLFTSTFSIFLEENEIIAWMPMPTIPLCLENKRW